MNTGKNGKIWGTTEEIFNKNNVSISRLFVEKNSHCSKHLHEHKTNVFWVESGKIMVEEWSNDYDLVDKTVLCGGEFHSVAPNVYHRFTGLEDSIVYEIYYVELKSEDIIREDVGGRVS